VKWYWSVLALVAIGFTVDSIANDTWPIAIFDAALLGFCTWTAVHYWRRSEEEPGPTTEEVAEAFKEPNPLLTPDEAETKGIEPLDTPVPEIDPALENHRKQCKICNPEGDGRD